MFEHQYNLVQISSHCFDTILKTIKLRHGKENYIP